MFKVNSYAFSVSVDIVSMQERDGLRWKRNRSLLNLIWSNDSISGFRNTIRSHNTAPHCINNGINRLNKYQPAIAKSSAAIIFILAALRRFTRSALCVLNTSVVIASISHGASATLNTEQTNCVYRTIHTTAAYGSILTELFLWALRLYRALFSDWDSYCRHKETAYLWTHDGKGT